MEWLLGSGVALVGVVVLVWRFNRERRSDPLIQWLVQGEVDAAGVTVSAKPIGGGVRDVRLLIESMAFHLDHVPLARAEWPVEKSKLSLTFQGMAAKDSESLYVRIIYRSNAFPKVQIEEWHPVFATGPASTMALRQQMRSPLRRFWLRLKGASALPVKNGVMQRVVTDRIARRELRLADAGNP